jgi:leucine-rich repeat kinase 1/leucine-rich repeat kinase 2
MIVLTGHWRMLDPGEISYQEGYVPLLGEGGYGKVYRGKCKGKSVAIKKYLFHGAEAITELRSEAKLLKQFHPCLVCLVGVCVHPLMALVLEEVPIKSLEFPILKNRIPIHRLTIFRIAAEVAAALRFLHSRGIIYRDLKTAIVWLWTLDPHSLCHCKLADVGTAIQLGVRGLQGVKSFTAPEVLCIGKRNQCFIYDHRADIFSFGMFLDLYQIIARRHPYHNIPPHRIDVAVESGERPSLQDIDVSRTGYHYLTQVMKACWEDNPKDRFDTDTIIKKVCQLPTQMVMCVAQISGKLSLRRANAITPSKFAKAGHPNQLQSELWVCCDGAEGAEISMFNTHSMEKINRVFIKNNRVQCMALCGDHVWVGS